MLEQNQYPQQILSSNIPQRLQNSVFRGVPEYSSMNACVGNNGNPDIYYYAEGFSVATLTLIDHLLQKDRTQLDILIYPICFNLRHSVELYLKGFIDELNKLAKIKKTTLSPPPNTTPKNILKVHDIGLLWQHLIYNSAKLDPRYAEYVIKLTPLIECINEVDPTGQTFRYSYDMDTRTKHLIPVAVINIINLREQFCIIQDHLESLDRLNQYLIQEYKTNTFTTKLSRQDICNIAERLPSYSSWAGSNFSILKNELKNEYNISNKELCKALDFIKKTYVLCNKIELNLSPLGLTEETLFSFITLWNQTNDLKKLQDYEKERIAYEAENGNKPRIVNLTSKEVIAEILNDHGDEKKAMQELFTQATPELIAGLYSLTEYSRDLFPETYVQGYETELKSYQIIYQQGTESWQNAIENIWCASFGKMSFPIKIIHSLRRLDMVILAKRTEDYCGLTGLV
ncbi:hypothetical protein RSE71_000813 [Yersinia enterocolitica]|nr:hypothetical protein [Yersinia enterocolitica]ELI8322821.1 hypothetical protein [Yersinia enterocolitica]